MDTDHLEAEINGRTDNNVRGGFIKKEKYLYLNEINPQKWGYPLQKC